MIAGSIITFIVILFGFLMTLLSFDKDYSRKLMGWWVDSDKSPKKPIDKHKRK